MLGGIIAGALQGGGQAVQHNAQSAIEEKRQKALASLKQEMSFERDDRNWEREQEMTQEERAIEERRRQEDREWQIADSEADRAHDTRLANIRASRSGGAGRVPSRIIEAQTLMQADPERWPTFGDAYNTVRSRAGQDTDYGQASDRVDYLTGQIDSIDNVLNDEDIRYQYTEGELQELQDRREMLFENLNRLEQDVYGIGAPTEQPAPTGNGGGSGGGVTPPPLIGRPGQGGSSSSGASGSWGDERSGQSGGKPSAEDILAPFL